MPTRAGVLEREAHQLLPEALAAVGGRDFGVGEEAALATVIVGTGIVSLLILWSSSYAPPAVIIVSFALWGGLALCIYSVCVAHACDLVDPDDIISTVSSLLFAWAAGVTL